MSTTKAEQMLRTHLHDNWQQPDSELVREATDTLEKGQVLYFPRLTFSLNDDEKKVLSPSYVKSGVKNISFNRKNNKLAGIKPQEIESTLLKNILKRFAEQSELFIHQLLPNYAGKLIQGRTSFRPVQISDRKTSYRKDDKRLHVDAFPATPNQGLRILRVFSNINPNGEDRVWRLGEPFEKVAEQFLPGIKKPFAGSAHLLRILRLTKSLRSEYDHIMLQMHDRMKADLNYQEKAEQTIVNFPPHTSWVVMTDHVSHAAIAGQHLLEQTFYVPIDAMRQPKLSPLRVLERMVGRELV